MALKQDQLSKLVRVLLLEEHAPEQRDHLVDGIRPPRCHLDVQRRASNLSQLALGLMRWRLGTCVAANRPSAKETSENKQCRMRFIEYVNRIRIRLGIKLGGEICSHVKKSPPLDNSIRIKKPMSVTTRNGHIVEKFSCHSLFLAVNGRVASETDRLRDGYRRGHHRSFHHYQFAGLQIASRHQVAAELLRTAYLKIRNLILRSCLLNPKVKLRGTSPLIFFRVFPTSQSGCTSANFPTEAVLGAHLRIDSLLISILRSEHVDCIKDIRHSKFLALKAQQLFLCFFQCNFWCSLLQ